MTDKQLAFGLESITEALEKAIDTTTRLIVGQTDATEDQTIQILQPIEEVKQRLLTNIQLLRSEEED